MTPITHPGGLAATLVCFALLGGPAAGAAQGGASAAPSGSLPDTIPIFPLPDLTLLPNTTQPFHIFEPRYRAMVADALAGDSIIGMVTLRPGFEPDYEGRPDVYPLGCAGVIVAAERLPDGRYDILIRGLEKFEILSEDDSRPYRLAEVDARPEGAPPDPELLAERRRQLEEVVRAAYPRAPLPPASAGDAEVIDGFGVALPLDPEVRQGLLDTDGPAERAARLLELIGVEVQAGL